MPFSLRPALGGLLVAIALWLGDTRSTPLQAASTTLVIHEFATRGGSGRFDEFVEIRNVSGSAISLDGWQVLGSDGNGAQALRATLPNVTLGAGCSWLLGNSQPFGFFGVADQSYSLEIPDDGGIALRSPGGTIVDAVGMSSGSAFGEGARLGALTINWNRGYERAGADTDNNATNFVLRTPSTPRRSTGGCSAATPITVTTVTQPNPAYAGDSVLLAATVSPGTNPASTNLIVEGNLSEIEGGNSRIFRDDGTNGDVTAGDGVYSLRATIPPGTTSGFRDVYLDVTDAQGRSASGAFSIRVFAVGPPTPPTAVTVGGNLTRGADALIAFNVHPGTNPTSTGLRIVMDLTPLGGSPVTELSNAGGGVCDYRASDSVHAVCFYIPAATPSRVVELKGAVFDAQGRSSDVTFSTLVNDIGDADGDGLLTAYESTFGLNGNDPAGDNGAAGDPDGDGRTNLEEQAANTHPRGFFTQYLAEGVTNAFFQTRVGLFDIGSPEGTNVLIRFQPEGLPERALSTYVAPFSRRTLTAEDTATFSSAPFATVVESDHPLIVDRTMTWGSGPYGSHTETAVAAPSTTWTLAEGATGWRFSLFYLLQNPGDQAAQVEVSYLRGPSDPVLTRTYEVPARQRRTISVDDEQFPAGSGMRPLASADVSARITVTNGVPIIVERSMYMSPDDQPFGAGHAAAGVAAPSTSWFFAEGSTGTFFDEFILLANAGATPANVSIAFTPEGREPFSRTYVVAPNSRQTIWVDQIPLLEATALSAAVTSDIPIVAERSMWWPGTGESWREAHVSAGATATGPRWAVADLEVGGPYDAHSFVLISGGGLATVYFDDDSPTVECGSSAGGRFTLHVNACPGVAGKRFVSVIVRGNANTVVERVTYFNTGGEVFAAGGGALATRID